MKLLLQSKCRLVTILLAAAVSACTVAPTAAPPTPTAAGPDVQPTWTIMPTPSAPDAVSVDRIKVDLVGQGLVDRDRTALVPVTTPDVIERVEIEGARYESDWLLRLEVLVTVVDPLGGGAGAWRGTVWYEREDERWTFLTLQGETYSDLGGGE